MDAVAHLEALIRHTGVRSPDVVIAHDGEVAVEGPVRPVAVDVERLKEMGCRVEVAELADSEAPYPHHDPARLGAVLRRLA
jgi:hypothetical protein